jgi:hypothetical protein
VTCNTSTARHAACRRALLARIDARWLIVIGFGISDLSMYHMTGIDLQMSFGHSFRVGSAIGTLQRQPGAIP